MVKDKGSLLSITKQLILNKIILSSLQVKVEHVKTLEDSTKISDFEWEHLTDILYCQFNIVVIVYRTSPLGYICNLLRNLVPISLK